MASLATIISIGWRFCTPRSALILTRDGARLQFDVLAALLAAGSAGLFAWGVTTVHRGQLSAAFSIDVATELITAGPYKYFRHPFYVSYLLSYLQLVLVSRSGWAIILLLWMAGIYIRAARLEERKFLRSPLSDDYCRYAARTAQFEMALTNCSGAVVMPSCA